MACRTKLLFDYGWRFHRGDIHRKPLLNYMATYHGASAESGRGGAAPAFDDSGWEIVDLPHDFVIQTKPEAGENEDHGYIRRENGWYRNYFRIGEADQGRRLSLLFDGVGTECIVWVNGVELKRNFTAGTSFEVDFTDVACYGDDVNVVSVYIDNTNFEGWYYEGGGIYRHVWLLTRDPLGIETDGVFVCPKKAADEGWDVFVDVQLNNRRYTAEKGSVVCEIYDADGRLGGVAEQTFDVEQRGDVKIRARIRVNGPRLWSLETPNLYKVHTSVSDGSGVVDSEDTIFGFRTLDFDPDHGFFLNGKKTMIRGMCVHQEHGGLGVAIPDGVLEYRVRRLQEMGCNAIRTAHNPPAPQLLDICDRFGMMIMEENRWLDSAPEGIRQMRSMIVRDRNHPCVIMWSMFNEEAAMEFDHGARIMNHMRTEAHKLDDSRPVTYAQNTGLLIDGVAKTGDLVGVNYNNSWYPLLHKLVPDRMLFGAETIGYINGRLNEPMDTWNTVLNTPYHGGIFAWTGFDYRGEAHWPDIYFRFGAMDPSGCAKDGYHLYQAYWTDKPCAHIATTWKHDAEEGSAQQVRVYTNGKSVELFAGETSLGRQAVDPAYQTMWEFAYSRCVLTAVAYDEKGAEIARTCLDPFRKPVGLKIVREEQLPLPCANARNVAVFNVWAVDEGGRICERAEGELVHIRCEGPAKLLCVGDGDVRDIEPWGTHNSRLRRGHCQIILRANDTAGSVALHAESEHLGNADIAFDILPCEAPEIVRSEKNLFISAWKRSNVYEEIKDPKGMLDQCPDGWIDFYTSDCEATHCILTDGCVGFYTETSVPDFGVNGKARIVFDSMEIPFVLRIEADGVDPFDMDVKQTGKIVIALPESFVPGTEIRIRIGMSPRMGSDQLSIRRNVYWRMDNK